MKDFFNKHNLGTAKIEEKYNSTPAEFYRDLIRAERDGTELPVWGVWKSEDELLAAARGNGATEGESPAERCVRVRRSGCSAKTLQRQTFCSNYIMRCAEMHG